MIKQTPVKIVKLDKAITNVFQYIQNDKNINEKLMEKRINQYFTSIIFKPDKTLVWKIKIIGGNNMKIIKVYNTTDRKLS